MNGARNFNLAIIYNSFTVHINFYMEINIVGAISYRGFKEDTISSIQMYKIYLFIKILKKQVMIFFVARTRLLIRYYLTYTGNSDFSISSPIGSA